MAKSLFEAHLENSRALDRAFSISAGMCKVAIARGDVPATQALTNTCALIFGTRMESRLYRLLHEEGAFTAGQRQRIDSAKTIELKWIATVEEAFAKRQGVDVSRAPGTLGFTNRSYYDEIVRLIKEELSPVITVRNILAHGQWELAFNSARTSIDSSRTAPLKTNRLWHLLIKANLLEHLVKIMHDLVVTNTAFSRDFDRHWSALQAARNRLDGNRYEPWEASLVRSHQKRPSDRGQSSVIPPTPPAGV